jgi:hypothetical protein
LGGAGLPPFTIKSRLCRRHRQTDIISVTAWDAGPNLAIIGVLTLKPDTRLGVDKLPVDIMLICLHFALACQTAVLINSPILLNHIDFFQLLRQIISF